MNAQNDMVAGFRDLLKEQTESIFALPFFHALSGGLSPEQWRLYAKQFHVTCISFDKLLDATIKNVRLTHHADLIAELEENLADEMGRSPSRKTPHSVLRKNFFRAIGLPEAEMAEDVGRVIVLPATQKHTFEVDKIINEGDVYALVGAFMAQEFLASGPGFRILKAGVKKSFPELTGPDSEPMRYVYGHIECDSMEHFPDLLKAIEPLMIQPDVRQKIIGGAQAMLNAERRLYSSFEQDILGMAR